MSEKLRILETFFQRAWAQQDAGAIEEYLSPIGAAKGLGAQLLVGPEGFKPFHKMMCSLLSDIQTVVDKTIEQDDWITVLITINAKSRSQGNPVSFTGSLVCLIKDGKVLEAYNHLDFMSLFVQLEALPADCFEKGMSGCAVVS